MDTPLIWAWVLVAAGVTAVLAVAGLRWPASPAARQIPPITHVLAGTLIGFIALAFFPALPLVAAIGGMLAVRTAQASRWTDAALLAIGFGAVWTSLIGYRMVNNALDPAVSSNGDLTPWLVAGGLVLAGGLVGLVWSQLRPGRFSRR